MVKRQLGTNPRSSVVSFHAVKTLLMSPPDKNNYERKRANNNNNKSISAVNGDFNQTIQNYVRCPKTSLHVLTKRVNVRNFLTTDGGRNTRDFKILTR